MTAFSKQDLIDFETGIAGTFNRAKIRAPVHLYRGGIRRLLNER